MWGIQIQGTKFTWIVVINIFAINLPSKSFLGRHLGFHNFLNQVRKAGYGCVPGLLKLFS